MKKNMQGESKCMELCKWGSGCKESRGGGRDAKKRVEGGCKE